MWFQLTSFFLLLTNGNGNIESCPSIEPNLDSLTKEQFLSRLTHPCRYDKLSRPPSLQPLEITMQIDLTHMDSTDQLQFKAHMLVQYIYLDPRLKYDDLSPKREPLLGKDFIKSKIWVPHVTIGNEKFSTLMGIDGSDVFIAISPQGEVVYSYRLTANFYCWMDLQKFPFDSQECKLKWNSWPYNSSDLILVWNKEHPVGLADNLHLTEFVLTKTWTEQSQVSAPFSKGAFVGNYSQLIFSFQLRREVGFYIMDYFLPSILLVAISWVTFWLQADAAPPRIVLGTSTMLAFITLNGALSKSLPKVAYIKASEIWFLGCAFFIFLSMAEFAFVNVIWRREKEVHVKKKNSKYILQGAITPSAMRKQQKGSSLNSLFKARSCSSLEEKRDVAKTIESNYLTVHSFPLPTIKTQSEDDTVSIEILGEDDIVKHDTWHTMTPHEVAIWIDRKSRIVFPASFLVFNVFYWFFVYLV